MALSGGKACGCGGAAESCTFCWGSGRIAEPREASATERVAEQAPKDATLEFVGADGLLPAEFCHRRRPGRAVRRVPTRRPGLRERVAAEAAERGVYGSHVLPPRRRYVPLGPPIRVTAIGRPSRAGDGSRLPA